MHMSNSIDYKTWIEQNKDNIPKEVLQRPDENSKHYFAFCLYLHLGPDRSLRKAWYKYAIENELLPRDTVYSNRIKISRRFAQWSIDHDWVKRAKALDTFIMMNRIKNTLERQTRVEDDSWDNYTELVNRIRDTLDSDDNLSARELKEVALAIKYADQVGRMVVGLPLTSTRNKVEEEKKNTTTTGDDMHQMDKQAELELEEWESLLDD